MSDIELFENAAKEYLRQAKDALDNGDCDLCIVFLDMARDEILGMVSAQQLYEADNGEAPVSDDLPFGGWEPNEADLSDYPRCR